MRSILPVEIERVRELVGPYGSLVGSGPNGRFFPFVKGVRLVVLASDGFAWEHVSVSPFAKQRTPTWEEMCAVKDWFWDAEEMVVQYHPAASEYVNFHPYCLHMFRPIGIEIPFPPSILVGPKRKVIKRH